MKKKFILTWCVFLSVSMYMASEEVEKSKAETNKTVMEKDIEESENLNKNYTIIGNEVLYKNDWEDNSILVKGADAETFTELKYSYAKDKNSYYYKEKKMNVDAETFET